ncbi:uncharacterized protein BT62DRAFT_937603 [Guyanagaster necrorhizus]|uniref:Uncharacterized protein n=1 Tax=Guyanagaster necrorhizus TaxID=856835 RepID=A0A9P7VHI7_9AGAR|nr:uncharacterized protein BT62DRAFT_937603 [Guyanagaster necrorhizus MCA 3950]KAG7440814.1 hypothetical protein BT62DRAFT_937603 [Guyanagaster necrorhizus MCA 3950]
MASIAVIADSISALSKSINQVFSEAEKSATDKLERAQNIAQDAKDERDDALKALHTAGLEIQEWKQKVKQAEMTITHQTETIGQLRREAAQWKDQSRNWQEHFLRVEQERCTLSSRLDEIVAERLLPVHAAPLTPISRYADHSGSPDEQTNSAPVRNTLLPPSPPEGDPPTPRNTIAKTRKQASTHAKPSTKSKPPITVLKTSTTPNPFAEPSTSKRTGARTPVRTETQQPRAKIIRRVRAVFHVKQEDDSGEEEEGEEEDELSEQDTSYRPPRHPSSRVVKDDDSDLFGGDEEDDDEEDELMIGPDDNDDLDKLPSHKRPLPTPASHASPTKKRRVSTATSRPRATGKKS